MRAAMATAALFTGRVGAFMSSGGLWRHGGIARTTYARSLSMAAGEGRKKVGFIGEDLRAYTDVTHVCLSARSSMEGGARGVCMIAACECLSCGKDSLGAVVASTGGAGWRRRRPCGGAISVMPRRNERGRRQRQATDIPRITSVYDER